MRRLDIQAISVAGRMAFLKEEKLGRDLLNQYKKKKALVNLAQWLEC